MLCAHTCVYAHGQITDSIYIGEAQSLPGLLYSLLGSWGFFAKKMSNNPLHEHHLEASWRCRISPRHSESEIPF